MQLKQHTSEIFREEGNLLRAWKTAKKKATADENDGGVSEEKSREDDIDRD